MTYHNVRNFINRVTYTASLYDMYTETHKHNNHAFTCTRKSDDEEFFVKRISKDSKEPAFAKTCQSPYTVKFHEYSPPYLVLENLPGGDLLSFISSNTLESSEIFVLLTDMLTALAVVHVQDVVHGDIKPENFVFAESDCAIDPGVEGNIKLCDYGSARKKHDRESELTGTLAYLAPEVVESSGGVSEKSDVYAVGCIAFLLVTGEPLVDPSLPDEEIVEIIRAGNFPDNRFLGKRGDMVSFVRALVARDPRDRPTAEQALAELSIVHDQLRQ